MISSVSIRIAYDPQTPVPFLALAIGEHVKLIKNPALASSMPLWLQQYLANEALRLATPTPPKRVRRQVAEVIAIDYLRQVREVRLSEGSHVGR